MASDSQLTADQFKNDPRIKQAQELLLNTLKEYQTQLTGIRPAKAEFQQSYQELLNEFSNYRGGKLYFPYIGSGFGKGALVELLDGSIKYDMISGIGVHYWGHHHPQLLLSNLDAALSDTIMQGHLQQNKEAIQLSKLLIQASGLNHCFLTSSGAMANENALKLAFQKKTPAYRLLAFEKCFMGRTLALAQLTDKPAFREGLPTQLFVDYIPFYQEQDPTSSTEIAIRTLKTYLQRYPQQHAAMCFELIQGEGGFNIGTTHFFKAIMEVLKEHQITIIIDEVQSFGRTTQLFAYQYFGLEDYVDIVTIGKLSQVCATLFKADYKPKAGLLSQTFTSSAMAIQAGLVIIKSLLEENYLGKQGKIHQIHEQFLRHFKRLEKHYPHLIQGPYGIGTMVAFTPLKGNPQKVNTFIQKLFQAGVISFIAGSHPSRVRFLIPIGAVTTEDVDHVMQIVEQVLLECEAEDF